MDANEQYVRERHGMSHTKVYKRWKGLVRRITKPHEPGYFRYGGRGLDMDPRWLEFSNFYADMGDFPKGTTLGRKDNNRGYWPDNCAWETKEEQANNTRTNVYVTAFGKTLTPAQWQRELGISANLICRRIRTGLAGAAALAKERWSKPRRDYSKLPRGEHGRYAPRREVTNAGMV